MGKIDDPKTTKPIIREPEPAGTPIVRKNPTLPNTKTGSHQPSEDAFRVPNKAPARDTRDSPAPNPDGAAKGQAPMTPKPHSPSSDTKNKSD